MVAGMKLAQQDRRHRAAALEDRSRRSCPATADARATTTTSRTHLRERVELIYHPVGTCRMGDGRRRGGRSRAARARPRGPARRRRLGHAGDPRRQHQRADDHGRRARRGPDQGPRADTGLMDLLDLDRRHVWHPYGPMPATQSRRCRSSSASGVRLTLADGRELIDGMASWWCAIHGYRHPALDAAVARPARPHGARHVRRAHARAGRDARDAAGRDDRARARLLRRLRLGRRRGGDEDVPPGAARAARSSSPCAAATTGTRCRAMSVCDPVGGMHSLFAGALRAARLRRPPAAGDGRRRTRSTSSRWSRDELCAVIVEPVVQGAGGDVVLRPGRRRASCARCATATACCSCSTRSPPASGAPARCSRADHAGVMPDVMCVGKALTGGYMTLAATLCTPEVASSLSRRRADARPDLHGQPARLRGRQRVARPPRLGARRAAHRGRPARRARRRRRRARARARSASSSSTTRSTSPPRPPPRSTSASGCARSATSSTCMPPYVMDDDDLARVCDGDARRGGRRMIVVTGTDTGVGKTVVCAAVCAITGWPVRQAVQTGDDDDAAEVARLAGVETRALARFAEPLAPASAGSTHHRRRIVGPGDSPRSDGVVEGAGGLLVRLGADGSTLADVARAARRAGARGRAGRARARSTTPR